MITGRPRPWVHLPERLAAPNGAPEVSASQFRQAEDAEVQNPARILGLAAALCLVLVRFGMLHELFTYAFGVRLFLQYVFGLPALLALVVSGGLRRTFQARTAYFWTAYALWMFVAAPFSSWKGASVRLAWAYFRSEFVLFLLIAGLVITWRECKLMLRAVACGGFLALAAGRFFQHSLNESRVSLTFGTVGDPNDYSCVMLLMLPLMLWLGLSSKWVIARLAVLPPLAYGLYLILSMASRGAVLGLLAEVVVFLLLGTMRQRVALLILGAIIVPLAVARLPLRTIERLTAFSRAGVSSEVGSDASESRALREYMLRQSIAYTFKNPLFGVGPGQMVNVEGQQSRTLSSPGVWQNAHNTFLQASSECGIPALVFFVGGLVSTYRLLSKTHRKARARADCSDIRTMVFCLMVGMGGFCAAATFLNFAYLFYAPALGALAIIISPAAEREFETRGAGAKVRQAAA